MMLISKISSLHGDADVKKMPRWSFPASFLQFRSFYSFYVIVVLGCVLLGSTGANAQTNYFTYDNNCRQCVEPGTFDANVDYFPDKITSPSESQDWSVEYENHYKIITNNRASAGSVSTFFAYLCGTPEPEIPVSVDAITIQIPLRNYVLTSATHIGYLEQIAQLESLAAFTSQSAFLTGAGLPCIEDLVGNPEVSFYDDVQFGQPTSVTAAHFEDLTSPGGDLEERKLDAIFVGHGDADAETYSAIPGEQKDCAVEIEISQSESSDGLEHLEWVEFVSLFFNKEKFAADITANARALYDCHSNAVVVPNPKPVVLYMDLCPFDEGIGYGLGSTNEQFYTNFINDAGGEMFDGTLIKPDYDGSVSVSEYETYFADPANAVNVVIAANGFASCNFNLSAFESATIYAFGPGQGVNRWFASRFLLPDRTLQEFISMINPSGGDPNRIYFKEILLSENGEASASTAGYEEVTFAPGTCAARTTYDLSSLSESCGGLNPIGSDDFPAVANSLLDCTEEVSICPSAIDNGDASTTVLSLGSAAIAFSLMYIA